MKCDCPGLGDVAGALATIELVSLRPQPKWLHITAQDMAKVAMIEALKERGWEDEAVILLNGFAGTEAFYHHLIDQLWQGEDPGQQHTPAQ